MTPLPLPPLRTRAERLLAIDRAHPLQGPLLEDSARLVHELSVHQVELELQNEELLRAAAELEASHARYRDLYDTAPMGYLTVDEAGVVQEANLTAAELLGRPRGELIDRPLTRLVAPPSQDAWYLFARHLGEPDAPAAQVFELLRAGLPPFWARVEARLLPAAPGGQARRRVIFSDVTRQQVAELALQESHAVNETLLRTMPLPMVIVDAQGTLLFASAHLEALQGRRLAGQRCGPLPRDDGPRCPDCPLRQPFAVGHTGVAICEGSPGGKAWEIFHTGLEYQGQPALLEVFVDITARRQAEAAQRKLQAELFQAQKMDAIGTLAGGVAHEFNNLLGGIRGLVSLVGQDLADQAQARLDLTNIAALVDRGAELARQLLGFAQRGQYDVRPIDLGAVLRRTTGLFGRTRADLAVQLEVAPELRHVLMDQSQLEQVLLSLFLNAGHAMPTGGRLRVGAAPVTFAAEQAQSRGVAAGEYVRVEVADTGVGMSPQTQARVFEPFFTTRPTGLGAGLGLSSVYGILHSHGGAITVTSAEGQGATFTMLLPVTLAEVPIAQRPSVTPGGAQGVILIVDDEPLMLATTSRLLKRLGYAVLTAEGGRAAVELVRQRGVELALVILDLTMPEMSGAETFGHLRALAPDLKVLLASGYSVEGQAQALLARGCEGFLQKPFTVEALAQSVASVMGPAPALPR